ncbi:MAG: hypothetical protein R3D98_14970 [Candidatus Krumholzibacteriia bacterium]
MPNRILSILLAVLFLAACSDDDCADCPEQPGDLEPTLDNIWPHADGTTWTYDLRYDVHEGPVPADEVPPLPTMAELHAALQAPVAEDLLSSDLGLYRLQFDGMVTTDTDITAQNLVETIYAPVGDVRTVVAEPRDRQDRFLRLVARVRPDLRSLLAERFGFSAPDAAKSLDEVGTIFFLGAYAFAAEDTGYYGYGDVSVDHTWTYIEGDLAPGTSWSLELLGGGSDLWLYGQVWSVGDQEVAGATYANAVEYMYVVDLGIQEEVDEEGNLLGSIRSYMYGATVFVPGVGPVACQERHVFGGSADLQDDEPTRIFNHRCTLVP